MVVRLYYRSVGILLVAIIGSVQLCSCGTIKTTTSYERTDSLTTEVNAKTEIRDTIATNDIESIKDSVSQYIRETITLNTEGDTVRTDKLEVRDHWHDSYKESNRNHTTIVTDTLTKYINRYINTTNTKTITKVKREYCWTYALLSNLAMILLYGVLLYKIWQKRH